MKLSDKQRSRSSSKNDRLRERDIYEEQKGSLRGHVIRDRYLIGSQIDEGSCGKVFIVVDLKNREIPLAIKVCQHSELFETENEIMRQIWNKSMEPNMAKLIKHHKVAIPEMKLYGKFKIRHAPDKIRIKTQNYI